MKTTVFLLLSMLALASGLTEVQKRSLASTLSAFGLSIEHVAQKLACHLHDGITIAACAAIVEAAASSILGPAAIVAGVVSEPLCDYALDHLQRLISGC